MWHQITRPADPADVAAVVALARDAVPRCGDTVVVAIDGPAGSGKTTLAKGVADSLGCPVVHMDLVFPGWDGLAEAVDLVTAQVLEPVSRGEQAAYRVWDWHENRWGDTLSVPRSPVLLLEGCACSVLPAGSYAAVRVWVEAPPQERMARGMARDGETFRPHWERWATQERELFERDGTRARADLRIGTGTRTGDET